ncbi:hypothetical protein E2F43_14940 [Seongchinamella unica]|uniref:Uncharacterized protein n=1 Tax=Seongchinamella unica TaxID=2547392 RepID=A0A4V2ZX37_9GAMM|nr:hypothetical protein [Seongchinamella unica]TDG12853.1 hypothetical protein E2F43_14940 [Seongchinamella unica]
MKLPTYQFVAQMAAAAAVVISLALVAYELKLSRDTAVGELAVSVHELEASVYLEVLDVAEYNKAIYKLENNEEELTWSEHKNLFRIVMTSTGIATAKYELWKLGLLSDAEWEWEVRKIKDNWSNLEIWRELMYSGNYKNDEFIQLLDEITTEWEAERASAME